MVFELLEAGRGYGPDYGMARDTDHIIFEVVNETTGVPYISFYLHRFSNQEVDYSAVYRGHHMLLKVIRDQEQYMLEEFVSLREFYENFDAFYGTLKSSPFLEKFLKWERIFHYPRTAQRILVLLAREFLAHSSAEGRMTSLQTSL